MARYGRTYVRPVIIGRGIAINKLLPADAGSYALTGTAATLRHAWIIAGGAGSYALTGTAATPKHAWRLSAAAGSYTLTGTAASTLHAWRLSAGAGSYALTGTNANLNLGKRLAAGGGSYSLTGTNATPTHAWRLSAGAGSYTLSGTAASLLHGWSLAAGSGSYVLTGTAATLTASTHSTAGTGGGAYPPRYGKKPRHTPGIVRNLSDLDPKAVAEEVIGVEPIADVETNEQSNVSEALTDAMSALDAQIHARLIEQAKEARRLLELQMLEDDDETFLLI